MEPQREITEAFADVDFPRLERSLRHPRTLFSAALSCVTGVLALIACVPLFSVLTMLIWRGGQKFQLSMLSQLPPAALEEGGGFGNAFLGTLLVVAMAAAISVPFGVLAATFLAEFGPDSHSAAIIRFCAKTLTGLPSILAGVFAYTAIVLATGTYSAPAAAVALAILMLPTILLTSEEAMRMVPQRMKEAAAGMGATRTQVVLKIVLPTAMPGVLTGIMLAVARAAGETAPLLFSALFSNYWPMQDELLEPTASLAVLIFNFASSPFQNQQDMAWSASLVLVILVLGTNICGQLFSRRRH